MPTGCHSTLTETNYWRTIASLVLQVVDAILNKGQSWHSRIKNHKPHFFILIKITSIGNILVLHFQFEKIVEIKIDLLHSHIWYAASLIFTVSTVSVSIYLLNKKRRLKEGSENIFENSYLFGILECHTNFILFRNSYNIEKRWILHEDR